MEETFNIVLQMMNNEGQVVGATLGVILLLLLVMIIVQRLSKRDSETDVELVGEVVGINASMDGLVASASVSDTVNGTVPIPDLDTPTSGGKSPSSPLEMMRELDGEDAAGQLDPVYAFSVEIKDTEPGPSHIAPNIAAETAVPEFDTASSMTNTVDYAAHPLGHDGISIPRQGAAQKPARFALFGKSWRSRKRGDVEHNSQATSSKIYDPALTPNAIANAVADLVEESQTSLATATAATTDTAQGAKAAAALDIAREMNEAGAIDEIERLAEVERKMRALRELFQAGLIAPEVYLLKAREYASETI